MKDKTTIEVRRSTLAAMRVEIAHLCDLIAKERLWVDGYNSTPKNPNAQGLSPDQLIVYLLSQVRDKRERSDKSSKKRTAERRQKKAARSHQHAKATIESGE